MFLAGRMKDYQILDTGEGMKLERWAGYTLARPDPQVIWPKQSPALWERADAVYRRARSGGGQWEFRSQLPERWEVGFSHLRFYVRPTGFKHTGLFPEQSANWQYIMETLAQTPGEKRVLNLFAYTGGATLAAASAGASVTHVDAAKGMVAWAKDNARLSGLGECPIRYIVDDCARFVAREMRRGNRYQGIIMDPPSYGRGANGKVWKLEEHLFALVEQAAALLAEDAQFFILNSYTTGLSAQVAANMLRATVCPLRGGRVEAGELALPIRDSSLVLPCGTTARWRP